MLCLAFSATFHNEAAAIARLEAIVWLRVHIARPVAVVDRITPVRGGRAGLRRCGPCKREFTVTVGTIFESSHIPLPNGSSVRTCSPVARKASVPISYIVP